MNALLISSLPALDGGIPTPIVVASGQQSPSEVQSNGSSAFWINTDSGSGTGSLMTATRSGGGAVTNLVSRVGLKTFSYDSSYAYFTVVPNAAIGASSIQRVSLFGGTPTPTRATALYNPGGVAADTSSFGYIFWTNGDAKVFRALKQ